MAMVRGGPNVSSAGMAFALCDQMLRWKPGKDLSAMNSVLNSRWLVAGLFIAAPLMGCAGHKTGPTTAPGAPIAVAAASVQRGATLADLTGGNLGLGGGFLIGAAPDKIRS